MKLKFWGYNEKNMGFHLTPKKVLLRVEPRGMRMQWEHTTLKDKKPCGAVCRRATYHNIIILRFIVLGRHHLTLEGERGEWKFFEERKKNDSLFERERKMIHLMNKKKKNFTHSDIQVRKKYDSTDE